MLEEQHRMNCCTGEVPFAGPAALPCGPTSPGANSPAPSPYHPFQQGLSLHAPSIPSCLPGQHLHAVSQFPSPMLPNSTRSVTFLCLQEKTTPISKTPILGQLVCPHPCNSGPLVGLSTYSIVSITRTSKEIEKAGRKRMSRQKAF